MNTQTQVKETPALIRHRYGGVITNLTSVGHNTDQNGCPHWFLRGDVKWADGGTSTDIEIAPNMLCYDSDNEAASREQINAASAEMNDYLNEAGSWLEKPKELKGGYLIHWMPKSKTGSRPLSDEALAALTKGEA